MLSTDEEKGLEGNTNIWEHSLNNSSHFHFNNIRNKGSTVSISNTSDEHARNRSFHNNSIFTGIIGLSISKSLWIQQHYFLTYRIMIKADMQVGICSILKTSCQSVNSKPWWSCQCTIRQTRIGLCKWSNTIKNRTTNSRELEITTFEIPLSLEELIERQTLL